jgi:hypothetical protein
MDNATKKVLIISPEPWGGNFVSKHHYAIAMAKLGHEVFFLNPPSDLNSQVYLEEFKVHVIDYRVFLKGINRLPNFIRRFFSRIDSRRINKRYHADWDIIWSFDPFRFQYLKDFSNHAKTIYYVADVHKTDLDMVLSKQADLIVGPSDFCIDKFTEHPNRHFINHGVSPHFLDYFDRNIPYLKSERLSFAYVGNLSMKFIDHELMRKCISQNPDVTFHLIGPSGISNLSHSIDSLLDNMLNEILNLSNVIHIPHIPNQKLPEYLSSMDGFIMCYDHIKWRKEASNSHKILELLSTGKVVLSLPIYHYLNNTILETTSQNEFGVAFKKITENIELYNSEENQRKRKDFAKSNSYTIQLNKILNWLKD